MSPIPLVEFLHRRVYLGAYDYVPENTSTRVYLTVDDTLPYNNFHHDFGPINIAGLFRFAVIFHDVLGQRENQGKEVVFYSYTDPCSRANAATLLASYMVLVQSWQPHQVLAPIAQMTPIMPFRDAGYSQADFIITVQDVVYGLWRAKNCGILEMHSFNLEEYEKHELVENGDLNSVGDNFVAFASPVTGHNSIKPVLKYFKKHNVQLVVRLNSPLYDSKIFEKEGIQHIDLIFDDGTCPTMAFVQGFLGAAEGVIRNGGKIAVHCRAGLGRTGCLIGAHLIYKYGFTAQEVIAYMRFMRPGMVVGPQQHWLYQHQHEFMDWRRTMEVSDIPDPSLAGFSPLVDASTIAARKAAIVETTPTGPQTPPRNILTTREQVNSCLPEPTPGQPRKPASPVRAARHSDAPAVEPRSDNRTPTSPRRTSGIYTDTNSDAEETEESLYECSGEEDEADQIMNEKNPRQQPLVAKTRNVSRSSLVSKSNSRSASGSRRSSSRSTSRSADSENTGVVVLRQRRNITDIASPQQQLALAKQLRVASNPSPHRRLRRESVEPADSS